LVEEVVTDAGAGVEDFDADEAAVFPVQRDEPAGAGWHAGLDGGAARCERLAGEVDAGGVGRGVVDDTDGLGKTVYVVLSLYPSQASIR